MLSLSCCGRVDSLQCDSSESRTSVVKIFSDDNNNALVNYTANNSNSVAALVGEAIGETKKAILDAAKHSAIG